MNIKPRTYVIFDKIALALALMFFGSIHAEEAITITKQCQQLYDKAGKIRAKSNCNKSTKTTVRDPAGKLMYKISENGRITGKDGKYLGKLKTK